MSEEHALRLKRLKIRSWRRGTKEMDMILGPFFDAVGADLSEADLDAYERLLGENDQDLYMWFSGQSGMPSEHSEILLLIQQHKDN